MNSDDISADTATTTAAGGRSKGESLVASFRAARISQRPALRSTLRSDRVALRNQRAARLASGDKPPAAAPAPAPADNGAPKARDADVAQEATISVFAGLVGEASAAAEAEQVPPAITLSELTAAVPVEPVGPAAPEPEAQHVCPVEDPGHALPLSAIGFGPGMTIRMRQLGIETVSALAGADADWLRASLGDISQLINVEAWIATARKASVDGV
jgi:hypothetical protein